MKAKQDKLAVSGAKLDEWVARFRFYREPPDQSVIERWLNLFAEEDRSTAEKVLDNVRLVSEREIQTGYKKVVESLPGWRPKSRDRKGRWIFVGFGSAGESGQAMVRIFREANGWSSSTFNSRFCTLPELPGLQLTAMDHVVFIDDFSGSGLQVCQRWPVVEELIASEASRHLVLTALTKKAEKEMKDKTSLRVHFHIRLDENDDFLCQENTTFSSSEKEKLLHYGKKADSTNPAGFGKCGLLFVLSHKTPNNTLPILHANKARWQGVFPRFLVTV